MRHRAWPEIRPVSGTGWGIGTRLRRYRDVKESHRRTAILNQPGWEIGFELAAGWHSGFTQSNGELAALETGVLFRLGLGEIERSPDTPWIFAPGAYVARQIRNNPEGPGWSVQASYHHAMFNGFPSPVQNIGQNRPRSDRLTLGFGWYQ